MSPTSELQSGAAINGSYNTIAQSTFTGGNRTVTHLPTISKDLGGQGTDQFWQWADKTPNGQLVTSYYDRSYGTDQATGYQ